MVAHAHQVIVGAGAGQAEERTIADACAVFARHGSVDVVAPEGLAELDRALADTGDRVLVVVGGDGTLHLVLDRLWSTRRDELSARRLGLVPLGTGNDFARGAGLPLDASAAAEVIVTGRPRSFDLLAADDGHVVVNAAHLGLGVAAALAASRVKRVLGPMAYPVGALVAGATHRGLELEVEVDGDRLTNSHTTVPIVGVANGPTIGGGTRLCPRARPNDGVLDVVVVTAGGLGSRIGLARDLRRGDLLDRPDVIHRRGRTARVTGVAARQNVDGEVTGEAVDRTYEVMPAAWSLIVAANGDGGTMAQELTEGGTR